MYNVYKCIFNLHKVESLGACFRHHVQSQTLIWTYTPQITFHLKGPYTICEMSVNAPILYKNEEIYRNQPVKVSAYFHCVVNKKMDLFD